MLVDKEKQLKKYEKKKKRRQILFSTFIIIAIFSLYAFSNYWNIASKQEEIAVAIQRPVIAILSQTFRLDDLRNRVNAVSYMDASYVKFIESAGARVVPIRIYENEQYYRNIFESVNGVVFPGGDVDLIHSQYGKITQMFFNWSIAAKQKNDYFPIWGTCLGFERLISLVEGDNSTVLSRCEAENILLPLVWEENTKQTKLLYNMSTNLIDYLDSVPSTPNFHRYCVTKDRYQESKKLRQFFRLISTSHTNVTNFVSAVESRDYPIYGTQFHPEKNSFEWNTQLHLDHSSLSIEVTQYLATAFVMECSRSYHNYDVEVKVRKNLEKLIYFYTPLFTGDVSTVEQTYYFLARSTNEKHRRRIIR
ncbi:hypothetical protein SNEBB_010000 [Seison nebaliae]|nr:hypothetical protein SNEBB_010000 [Seison nebaliae]